MLSRKVNKIPLIYVFGIVTGFLPVYKLTTWWYICYRYVDSTLENLKLRFQESLLFETLASANFDYILMILGLTSSASFFYIFTQLDSTTKHYVFYKRSSFILMLIVATATGVTVWWNM